MLDRYLADLGANVDNDVRCGDALLITQQVSWSSFTETMHEARARWQPTPLAPASQCKHSWNLDNT